MSTITFLSGHFYPSPRRAGFHNLADAAHALGHKVNFVTVGYSLLSRLRRDYRNKIPGIREHSKAPALVRPGFVSYVHATLWHPMTLLVPILNRGTMRLMDRYGEGGLGHLADLARETDIFVYESTPGLFLFKRLKRERPEAKTVYRVSDDVRVLRSAHPRLIELEAEIAPLFDCVSVPNVWMLQKFPRLQGLRLDRHGIDRAAYDACEKSPYPPGTLNAVCVTTWNLDRRFLSAAAAARKDVHFHIIGPLRDDIGLPNVRFYGEMPFAATIPHIKFADVGLHCIDWRNEHSRAFADALKVVQYRYCGLPIIAPDFLDLNRDGIAYYWPGDDTSCAAALDEALAVGKDASRANEVRSWREVAEDILSTVGG